MRFVRSFTNFSGKIDAALMRVEGWLFPRMRRRWIRCVLSYLLFVSLFAWFALRLYGPGGAVDPTSRHRRGRGGTKGCIKKKTTLRRRFTACGAVVPFDSIIIIGLVVKKKTRRNTNQSRDNATRTVAYSLSPFFFFNVRQ